MNTRITRYLKYEKINRILNNINRVLQQSGIIFLKGTQNRTVKSFVTTSRYVIKAFQIFSAIRVVLLVQLRVKCQNRLLCLGKIYLRITSIKFVS